MYGGAVDAGAAAGGAEGAGAAGGMGGMGGMMGGMGGMMGGMGGGGGGDKEAFKYEKPDVPERNLGGMREGFRRLDEVGARQRTYGTP